MNRSLFNSFAERRGLVLVVALWVGLAVSPVAQSPARSAAQPAATASGDSLLARAVSAEAELRLELAKDHLYEILLMHPGTGDAVAARLRLARLLALSGDLQASILECQLLREELPSDHPLREQALSLATTLGRRLRAVSTPGSAYFATIELSGTRGVATFDEPRTIAFEGEGRFVVLDEGAGRVYRVGGETATQMTVQDPTAVAVMPDGSLLIAGKTGLTTVPPSRTILLSGMWGGRTRQVRKVRSIAPLSTGDVLVIDRDYDGLLRCQLGSGMCAPAGPAGKYRVVKAGIADWSYLLDDRGQSVRVLDAGQRQIAAIGPMLGAARLERVEDISVDGAYGLYLIDKETKRLHIVNLRSAHDGTISAVVLGSVLIPQEGDRAMKNPSAMGMAPSGALTLAGESAPRVMRLR